MPYKKTTKKTTKKKKSTPFSVFGVKGKVKSGAARRRAAIRKAGG